jgi:hypothetical protein
LHGRARNHPIVRRPRHGRHDAIQHNQQLGRQIANTCWVRFTEIKTIDDLREAGSPVGSIPTDLEQSTGLERLEILGKMEGVDIFDMRPLDSSRLGTIRHIGQLSDAEAIGALRLIYLAHAQELFKTPSLSDLLVMSSTPVALVSRPTPTPSTGSRYVSCALAIPVAGTAVASNTLAYQLTDGPTHADDQGPPH